MKLLFVIPFINFRKTKGSPIAFKFKNDPSVPLKFPTNYDPQLPTKVVIHGWRNSVSSPVCQQIKDAYLQREDMNVLGMHFIKSAVIFFIHFL